MQSIDFKGMSADEIQKDDALPLDVQNLLTGCLIDKKSGQEQEQPRNQGKIIRGIKAFLRKAEISCQIVPVQSGRQRKQFMTENTQKSGIDMLRKGKQNKTDKHSRHCWDFLQNVPASGHEEHTRADERQNAEQNQIFRHEKCCYQCDACPKSEDGQTSPEQMPAHARTESG